MLKVLKDTGFQMMVLYVLTLGIYGQASVSMHYPIVHDKNVESHFVVSTLSSSPYVANLQQKDIDLKNARPTTIKMVKKAFSVDSVAADEVVVNQVSCYIERFSLVIVTPSISDILYPFHYHL